MLDWLCTKMAKPPPTVVPVKNSAAHSASPSVAFAPVTTRTGITGRKTGVALNTGSFPRTTGFPLTAAASISRGHTLCVQSAKDTTPALRRLGRNDYGCATEPVWQTSIHWPIFPLWLLLLPLFSLALTPTAHLNHLGDPLNGCSYMALFARFSTGLAFDALFLFTE